MLTKKKGRRGERRTVEARRGAVLLLPADFAAAGIEKRDANRRTVDVHALRHTFGTMLARAGVGLAQAQRLIRHSDPKLTSMVYTRVDPTDV